MKVSPRLNFFRDMAVSISLVMLVVAFIAAILAVIQIGITSSRPISATARTGCCSLS